MKILNCVVCFSTLLTVAPASFAQDEAAPLPRPLPPGMGQPGVIQPGGVQPGMLPPGMGPEGQPPLQPQVPGQNAGGPDTETVQPTGVYVAEQNELSLLARAVSRFPSAVSLRASEQALEANPTAKNALMAYVRAGGTVFLHTGAARVFGYTTVEARPGSNTRAGQLYGRARAALPFGSHPLLWDDGKPVRRSVNYDPTLLPGVNLVYYELQPGDHLVVSHPAGTPLLQVSDLSSDDPTPLYAAAIAPFGKGYAIFTPDVIDQKRADGALFARNLTGLLAPTKVQGRQWVGIPASAVEKGTNAPAALRAALNDAVVAAMPAYSPALPAFGTAPPVKEEFHDIPPLRAAPVEAAPVEAPLAPDETQVFISRGEAASYGAMLDAGGARGSAAIDLLQARLLMARNDGTGASRIIEAGADYAPAGAPGGAEISLWRGILMAGASQEMNQSSVVRANLLADAANELAVAANGAPAVTNNRLPGAGPRVAGIAVAAIRDWGLKMGRIAQVFALEPPFVQQYGVGDSAITMRGFQNDASLQLVALGVAAVAQARNLGWRGDNEEVIVFPTIQAMEAYRTALGVQGPTVPMPAGSAGDVMGQRLIMVAVPSFPLVETDPNTGDRRVFAAGNNTANVFARLHSYVLLNALDEGGTGIPTYMQLGIEALIARIIDGDNLANNNEPLVQLAKAGGLLTPDQFMANEPDPVRYQVAQLQAAAVMAYFYEQFGAGAVVETIQRLGAGQSADDAFNATTQDTETALFQSWRDAQFGPQQFPNNG